MKKTWEEPKILVQKFVANEYVAACGEEKKVYKFECNAGSADGYGNLHHYRVYTDDGRLLAGLLSGLYGPCGETHDASTKDDFLEGYMDDVNTWGNDNIPVIIWTEGGTNVHCTTNLDMDDWTTAKS